MARFWRHDERLSPYDDDAFTPEELEMVAQTIRESSFLDDHSGKSIEERLITFFHGRPPHWICFQSPDAVCYVNCCGVLSEGRRVVRIELQFELSDDLESFALTGLMINNRPQSEGAVADFEAQFATIDEADDHSGHEHTHCDCDEEDDNDDDFVGDLDGWDDYEHFDDYDSYGEDDDAWYDDETWGYEGCDQHDHCSCGHDHSHRSTEDNACGCEIIGSGNAFGVLKAKKPFFDFDAEYVEPPEEPEPENNVTAFGKFGAFADNGGNKKK